MPIYEYLCNFCNKKEEKIEIITASKQQDCPYCKAPFGMERKISMSSFILAGGGWMAQNYSKSNNTNDKTNSTKSNAAINDVNK